MHWERDLSQLTAQDFGSLLKRIRHSKDYSQQEMADALNVGFTTYQKWEQGKRVPHPGSRRVIREVFKDALQTLGIATGEDEIVERVENEEQKAIGAVRSPVVAHTASFAPSESPADIVIVIPPPEGNELATFLTCDPTMRLFSFAYVPYQGYQQRHRSIVQTLRELDTMNTSNKSYQIDRREALCRLIALPFVFAAAGQVREVSRDHEIEGFLSHCASGIAACWELYRSSDASNTQLAFESVSRYIPALTTIARQSAQHRTEALDLATRSALVRTLLAWDYSGPATTVQYAQDAVMLSTETRSASLQLSAYSKLAWAYFYNKQAPLALAPAQKGVTLLERVQSKLSLPPSTRGGTYSTLALMQANNGLSPDKALGKATELDPGRDHHAFMTFSPSCMMLEAALTQYHYGNQQAALQWFTKRVDPETLSPKFSQSMRGKTETINGMLLSSLKTSNRDKEQIISWWKASMEGARTLKSERCFQDALTAYGHMEFAWPDDTDIRDLRDLTKHW